MCNRNCTVMGFIVSNQEMDEGKRGEKEGGGEGEREEREMEREMERGREREGGREERERLGRCCYSHSSLIIHSSRARVLISPRRMREGYGSLSVCVCVCVCLSVCLSVYTLKTRCR